jgi:hypothetical protein
MPTPDYHGSPANRGHSDGLYRRTPQPHKLPPGNLGSIRIPLADPDEIAEYMKAYENTPKPGRLG